MSAGMFVRACAGLDPNAAATVLVRVLRLELLSTTC